MRPKELVCMTPYASSHSVNGFYLTAFILAGGSDQKGLHAG